MLNESVCTLLRVSPEGNSQVLCAHNVSDREQEIQVSSPELGLPPGMWNDLLSGEEFHAGKAQLTLTLAPYDIRWLKI